MAIACKIGVFCQEGVLTRRAVAERPYRFQGVLVLLGYDDTQSDWKGATLTEFESELEVVALGQQGTRGRKRTPGSRWLRRNRSQAPSRT